jgi:hypothetical protein
MTLKYHVHSIFMLYVLVLSRNKGIELKDCPRRDKKGEGMGVHTFEPDNAHVVWLISQLRYDPVSLISN